ncbi:MAG: class I SAM-dependent methyltransferase [Verrucomicrobia bacterium]|nr:class I SAM-dependent methyltransferase [Verrucomicrobiota bacterium]
MKHYTLKERAQFYSNAHPKWPPMQADDRWLSAMWIMGNNYRTSGYYGAYPHTYLERIGSIFPDAQRVLLLFSGSLPPGSYVRFDMPSKAADVTGDAHHLSAYFPNRKFDLIYADPPYSVEDSMHYGCAMVSRNTVLQECAKVVEPGGFIVWLDQVLPMFRKAELYMCGVIGMVKSTNHRFRVATIFERLQPPALPDLATGKGSRETGREGGEM